MTLTITLLGTGSPIPSPDRAGPATLISAGSGRPFPRTIEIGDDLHRVDIEATNSTSGD